MNVAFISTRFAGTDGVSLESVKMAHVLQELDHTIVYCAGELDPALPGVQAPPLHFTDPVAVALGQRAFGGTSLDPTLLTDIHTRAALLREILHDFLARYDVDYIIAQNVFAIPMQLPLAQALAEAMQAHKLPGLAHNHDLYWERDRFRANRIPAFLDTYFPPALPRLQHATINSLAQAELQRRRNLPSVVIPNVFDFDIAPPGIDAYNAGFRQTIGLSDDDWFILQPTRVIPRKGIELAIELVARLDDPRCKLVITHEAGDEGLDYLHALQHQAAQSNVDLRTVAAHIDDHRRTTTSGRKIYSLWDAYAHADLVTYPSLVEGFGNALLETIYFRLPALVNRYDVYAADIGPLGFRFAEIDGAVTPKAVSQVRQWLVDPRSARDTVEHNYNLAREHFSYRTLRRLLPPLLTA